MPSSDSGSTVLRLEESTDHVTLHVEGPLTGRAFHAASKILDARKIGGRPLWIDLKEMTSIDTGGLGVLILAGRLAIYSPGVRIRGAAAEVCEMLRLVRLRVSALV